MLSAVNYSFTSRKFFLSINFIVLMLLIYENDELKCCDWIIRLIDAEAKAAAPAYVGLAKPGADGTWQTETKVHN